MSDNKRTKSERRGVMIFTAIIEREGDGYVALCPELDIASQGDTVEQARINLREAVELFFETAYPEEVGSRLRGEGVSHV
jgi:predicted RNase H-like HicB family nuclease